MKFKLRSALPQDTDQMLALMPRLASFDLPASRTPEHLWRDDAALLQQWSGGKADNCLVNVAVDSANTVLGFALVSLRPELLSHEPSAHLEAIAVAQSAEGIGVGKALMTVSEETAKAHGAQTITLHVFANNKRARRLYERAGYDGELMRYIKPLVS